MKRIIFFSLSTLAACVWLFCSFGNAVENPGDVITSWQDQQSWSQWKPLVQVKLDITKDGLRVTGTGNDPHMIAPATGPAGWKKLTIVAAFKGRLDTQLFWTTTRNPGTSERRSLRFKMNGRGAANKHEVYFYTQDPITQLRIDPHSAPTKLTIKSMTLVASTAPPAEPATDPSGLVVPDGFKVELLYSVPKQAQGSWVSMTSDPKGRLIVCDQYGSLYRVTPPPVGVQGDVKIERINVELGEAQGLLYAFNGLYVVVNRGGKFDSGLYKVTDSDGDDQLDKVVMLKALPGRGGEHGPHSIVLSPDGKSLYMVAGNNTTLPEGIKKYRVPKNWGEDQLLPRQPCSNGHNTNVMAPGGWVARVSPDGKQWELVASGFRNPYDIAFNRDGELFTYDADMEMDVGTPWYRPTRVCHVVSGAEFGWRFGTGKWLPYFTDNLPPVVDVGQGSPTGVSFGYGADFPRQWQDRLYVSDWTYGKLYAVKLKPSGSSYGGELEEFITGIPFPLTDVIVNPHDKAMYITIGGRRTQSGLYRVTYVGPRDAKVHSEEAESTRQLRAKRRALEAYHAEPAPNMNPIWAGLSHGDRHVRYAARIALEHQSVDRWASRALQEKGPNAAVQSLLALVRSGDKAQQQAGRDQLAALSATQMSEQQQLDWLRALNVAFARRGGLSEKASKQLGDRVARLLPTERLSLNHEICRMLVYLGHPAAVTYFIPKMEQAKTQEDVLFYGMVLRVAREGWSQDTRKRYLQRMNFAEQAVGQGDFVGGGHYQIYVQRLRADFVAALPAESQKELDALINAKLLSAVPTGSPTPRKFIKNWQVADLLADANQLPKGRSFAAGKNMFQVASCVGCHRFGKVGGILGPDITGAARRYSSAVLLREIIEPSVQVSDQFKTHAVLTVSGKVYQGRILDRNEKSVTIAIDPKSPASVLEIKTSDIEEVLPSKTSMMPLGLLNTLTREQILDLLAYIQSGGDPEHPLFK